MQLYDFDLSSSSDGNEIVMTGWHGRQLVVARMPKFELEEYFRDREMTLERAKRIVAANLDVIERAVRRKYKRGDFHTDTLGGQDVRCVHVGPNEIVKSGEPFFDPSTVS
jgi:hypothetical protein